MSEEWGEAWRLFAERGIRTGTASWTDKTMLEPGLFYPEGVSSAADRLTFYASHFPLVEVDSTYYGLPSERNAKLWRERTPDGFLFNVKAFSLLTQHPTRERGFPRDLREAIPPEVLEKRFLYLKDVSPDVVDETWDRFCSALRPLAGAGKLGAVLFQFPEWFTPARRNREYVLECRDRLADRLPGVAPAVELRSAGWMRDAEDRERTLSFLADHGLPYVCVDMPQGFRSSLPPVAASTAPLSLVRFHGRNRDNWDKKNQEARERFRYDYPREELAAWAPRVEGLASEAREVHVLMNNCYRDYAVRSARTMVQLTLG